MATSAVAVFTGTDTETWNIIATATADAALNFAHGLGAIPADIFFTPLLAAAYISQWRVQGTLTTANTMSLVKTSVAASANAAAQLRLKLQRPHTLGR